MNMRYTLQGWLRTALVLVLASLPIPDAAAHSVGLDVQMSRPLVMETGSPQKAYVRIALTGLEAEIERRAPLTPGKGGTSRCGRSRLHQDWRRQPGRRQRRVGPSAQAHCPA